MIQNGEVCQVSSCSLVPIFNTIFCYKMEIFPFDKNNPKNLDPFYKKDLDFFGIIFEGKISYCSSFSQD